MSSDMGSVPGARFTKYVYLTIILGQQKDLQTAVIMSLSVWFVFRSSDAKSKSQAKNADSTKTASRDAVGDSSNNEVKQQRTQDDSMINTDSSGQRRQKPTTKRRLASFRLLTHYTRSLILWIII